jgi:hypothetical protein
LVMIAFLGFPMDPHPIAAIPAIIMGQRVSKEVAKRTASADPITGFFRGAIHTPQEEAQEAFLERRAAGRGGRGGREQQQQQQGSKPTTAPEMPPELIKFMTDVGPLKTNRNNDPSGGHSEPPRKTRLTDSSRKTENMRLAEQIEGYETARTTSFSTKRDKVDENDFGLDVIQMFGLLSSKRHSAVDESSTSTSPAAAAAAATETPPLATNIPSQHAAMVELALKAIQLPVLMEDRADQSFIGVAPDRVNVDPELQALTLLPKTRVKLVLEDLWEIDNNNNDNKMTAASTP